MLKINTYSSLIPLKISVVIMMMLIVLPYGDAFAQKKKKKKTQNLEIRLRLSTTYDNNILKYSDKYLQRFMNGEDEGRFHINTYDDLILFTSLKMYYTFRVFGKLKSIASTEISRRTYLVNDIKNWNYWYVGFQQYFTKRASLKLSYSYIPAFYVRHFRNRQWVEEYGFTPETFKPYVFSKDYFGVSFQNTYFKNTRISLSLNYARYFHNEYFTEYDSKDFIYGIRLYQPIHKKIRLKASYEFVTSDAKGYNSITETPETSLGPDATFAEDRFSLGFLWYLPRISNYRHNLDVKFGVLLRYYSSKYSPITDPLHAGRVDNNYRFSTVYRFNFSKSLQLSAYYKLFLRDSGTTSVINDWYVSNEKDYSQYHLGVEITYKINY